MTRIVLTPSQVESYLRCPWKMYLEQCKFKPPRVFENELGTACHEFVAGLHRPKESLFSTIKHTTPRFSSNWINAEWHHFWIQWLQRLKKEVSRLTLADFLTSGLEFGPLYIERYLRFPRALEIQGDKVEVEFRAVHIPDTSVHLSARVDQIRPYRKNTQEDVIIDLKFSKRNNFDPQTNLALRSYALLWRLKYEKPEKSVCIWNVPFGRAGISYATLTETDVVEMTNTLRKVGSRISRRAFNVADGKSVCNTCPHKEMCGSPSSSLELRALAFQNTRHKGLLPRTRTAIIQERVLEPPGGKPLEEPNIQAELPLSHSS